MRLKQLVGASIVAIAAAVGTAALSTPALADYYAGLKAFDSKNYTVAAQEWMKSAQAGDARSQFRLGILYAKGLGVPQNKETAYYWYKKADKAGNADAGIAAVFLKKELPAARSRAIEARIASEGTGGGGGGGVAGRGNNGNTGNTGNTGNGAGNGAMRSLFANAELRRVAPGTQGRERYEIWKFNPDGTLSGTFSQTDAGSLALTREGNDRGRWAIEGNALCVTWKSWDEGRKRCYLLTPQGRNKYRARDAAGTESWSATISPR